MVPKAHTQAAGAARRCAEDLERGRPMGRPWGKQEEDEEDEEDEERTLIGEEAVRKLFTKPGRHTYELLFEALIYLPTH
jgi:hypothetical protein